MSKRSWSSPSVYGGLSLVLASACGSPPAPAPVTVQVRETNRLPEIERYLPLENGTVYSYDTSSEGKNSHGVLIVQISRPREGRVDLRMGAKTERLELQLDGVAYLEGGYLMKAPITTGATWRSKTGTVKVETTEETVKIPAGEFHDCVRTVEESHEPSLSRAVRTTFCPHVGIVSLEVEATSDRGAERETAILRSFGPRVDLAAGDDKTITTTTTDP